MFHPLFNLLARIEVRRGLVAEGHSPFKAGRTLRQYFDDAVETAAATAGVAVPAQFSLQDDGGEGLVGAFGDGEIIKAIREWLRSEEGRAFVSTVLKLILAILMGL